MTEETLVNEVENQTNESVELDTTADQVTEEVNPEAEAETEEKAAKEVNPKTLENAISRRDKKINKMKAENYSIKQEVAELKEMMKQFSAGKEDKKPNIDDYDTVEAFVEAVIEHKEKTKQKAQTQPQANPEQLYKMQEIQAKQVEMKQVSDEYSRTIPDFKEVMEDYSDVFNEMPDHIAELFFQVDDGAIAAYNLAKSGKLENLSRMNPAVAALEVYKAQEGRPMVKKVTSAPKPISPLRGNGSGQKSTDEMSGRELLKQYRLS